MDYKQTEYLNMKRMVLCFALLLMSFSAFAQSYGPVRDLGYRNEFFITPSAFFDGTFALGYQRNFETFALSLMPSITLMGDSVFHSEDDFYSALEGYGLEGVFKFFFARMPRKAQVYAGPYLGYRYLSEKNTLPPYINPENTGLMPGSELNTRYNTLSVGVMFGLHFMWGRFTMDLNMGGGVRYPEITGFRKNYPTLDGVTVDIPDDFGELGYKGVVPKGSFTLGVAF
ncbi:MAG TPA: hypothetical protein PKM89_03115 [Bacteroidales bacterium]|nr:hypothetical protein [Bacteroidales bacterium]